MPIELKITGLDRVLSMLDPKKVDKAASMTINRVGSSTRTKASDIIRNDRGFKLKKTTVDKRLVLKKARPNAPAAVLRPKKERAKTGKTRTTTNRDSFSLLDFGAKDVRKGRFGVITTSKSKHGGLVAARTKRTRGPGGVKVKVRKSGKVAHFPQAFITQMPSGHSGVFRRLPGTKMRKKKKERISEIRTISVATMFKSIRPKLIVHARNRIDGEFVAALRQVYRKGKGR